MVEGEFNGEIKQFRPSQSRLPSSSILVRNCLTSDRPLTSARAAKINCTGKGVQLILTLSLNRLRYSWGK
jgi:hypothetical protein